MVSICLPTYNSGATILDTLDSILGQTYRNLEVLVLDNASTDDTLRRVRSRSDKRIVVHENATNIGAEGNFTRAIDLASGKYTAIYHADDLYDVRIVEKQVAVFDQYPAVGAVFTEADKIDESGRLIGHIQKPAGLTANQLTYSFPEVFRATLRDSNQLVCPSAMLRTEIYQNEIHRYRSDLFGSSADLDVWFRVLLRHQIAILPEKLVQYRISTDQGSNAINRQRVGRADFFRVMDYYLADRKLGLQYTSDDMKRYGWLQRTDRVIRAMNLCIQNDFSSANGLCGDLYTWDAVEAATHSLRGLQTFLLGNLVKLICLFRAENFGRMVLQGIKRIMHR